MGSWQSITDWATAVSFILLAMFKVGTCWLLIYAIPIELAPTSVHLLSSNNFYLCNTTDLNEINRSLSVQAAPGGDTGLGAMPDGEGLLQPNQVQPIMP